MCIYFLVNNCFFASYLCNLVKKNQCLLYVFLFHGDTRSSNNDIPFGVGSGIIFLKGPGWLNELGSWIT